MEQTTQMWVAALKRAYPHLPATLPQDLEIDLLGRLSRWYAHIEELRAHFDQISRDDLPEELRNERGKRQIIPVLMSLDSMTDTEVEAWHILFVCLSAQLADIGTMYWKTQQGARSTMALHDVLNYLPVVFLYVLSSYNPYPKIKEHSEQFAHAEDGRVRLITWVSIDARRHISTYLQQHLATVRPGTAYLQRLRQAMLAVQRETYVTTGQMPTDEQMVTALQQTHYGAAISESTLLGHVSDLSQPHQMVSLSDPMGRDPARETSLEQQLIGSYLDIESFFDPQEAILEAVQGHPTLHAACSKLLDPLCHENLSLDERWILGS